MTAIQTTLIARIVKQLHWIEAFLLTLLGAGAVLTLLNIDASSILLVSLSGLSIVFFLRAYQPPASAENENTEPSGFKTLLALVIIPKVIWISTSISTVAILFYLMKFERNSYEQMLLIGSSSLFISLLILGFLSMTELKDFKTLVPVLLRAFPVLILDIYFLSRLDIL